MDLLREVLSLILVFVLLGGALWALRRQGRIAFGGSMRKNRSLEAVERLALTPQHSLHLVRIHGREVVVATHPQGCAVLVANGDGE